MAARSRDGWTRSAALASRPIRIAASRQDADAYFLAAIRHYVYAGDTALHVAAAAYQRELAESLVAKGADVRARNRRGAEPLHYAADGGPDAEHWDPVAQREVIAYLIDSRRGSQRVGQEWRGSAASSRSESLLGGGRRPHRERCRSAAEEQERFDPAAPCRSEHRQEQFRLGGGKDEQGRIIALLLATRRESDRCRCERQDRRGRGIQ